MRRIKPPFAADVALLGRRLAKATAGAVLPSSLLVVSGPKTRRRVALTFDDGPGPQTARYLDILDRFGAFATFFVVGEACVSYPEMLDEIVTRGHELGGHGYTHTPFPALDDVALNQELKRTLALLPPLMSASSGEKQRPASRDSWPAEHQTAYRCQPHRARPLVRPPRGEVSLRSLLSCASAGFSTVLWSRDSEDWRRTQAREIVQLFEQHPPQAGDILLFHEGQTWTLSALPNLLERLTGAGYELVTVSHLLAD